MNVIYPRRLLIWGVAAVVSIWRFGSDHKDPRTRAFALTQQIADSDAPDETAKRLAELSTLVPKTGAAREAFNRLRAVASEKKTSSEGQRQKQGEAARELISAIK